MWNHGLTQKIPAPGIAVSSCGTFGTVCVSWCGANHDACFKGIQRILNDSIIIKVVQFCFHEILSGKVNWGYRPWKWFQACEIRFSFLSQISCCISRVESGGNPENTSPSISCCLSILNKPEAIYAPVAFTVFYVGIVLFIFHVPVLMAVYLTHMKPSFIHVKCVERLGSLGQAYICLLSPQLNSALIKVSTSFDHWIRYIFHPPKSIWQTLTTCLHVVPKKWCPHLTLIHPISKLRTLHLEMLSSKWSLHYNVKVCLNCPWWDMECRSW